MGVFKAAASSRSAVPTRLGAVESILEHPCPNLDLVGPAIIGTTQWVGASVARDPCPDDPEEITSRLDAAPPSSLGSRPLVGNDRGEAVAQGVIKESSGSGDLRIVLEEHGALRVVPCSTPAIFVHLTPLTEIPQRCSSKFPTSEPA